MTTPGTASRSAMRTGPVVEAARAAMRPPGPVRWIAETVDDRIELRITVRRWSTVAEPSARVARISCGTALRAARLAVAVQGRRPVVTYPERAGVLAVLHAGGPVVPGPWDVLLHGVLRRGAPASPVESPTRTAAVRWLRQAAESEGTWLTVLPVAPPVASGPCWGAPQDDGRPTGNRSDGIVALVGASGRLPVADLRLGQALETIGLAALALGLDVRVLAAPASPATTEIGPHVVPATDSLAVVRVHRPLS